MSYRDIETKPPRFFRHKELELAVKSAIVNLIDDNIYPTYEEVSKIVGPNKSVIRILSDILTSDEIDMPEEMIQRRIKNSASSATIERRQTAKAKLWAVRSRVMRQFKNDYRVMFGTTQIGPSAIQHIQLPEDGSTDDVIFLWFSSMNYLIIKSLYDKEMTKKAERNLLLNDIDDDNDDDDEAKFRTYLSHRKEVKA